MQIARVWLKGELPPTLHIPSHQNVGGKATFGRSRKQQAKKLVFVRAGWQRRQRNIRGAAAEGQKT
jgi:hypothetical protein